jgi:hypothetical protein
MLAWQIPMRDHSSARVRPSNADPSSSASTPQPGSASRSRVIGRTAPVSIARSSTPTTGSCGRKPTKVIVHVLRPLPRQSAHVWKRTCYAIPSRKAKQLTKADRQNPVICYLFRTIRPELVFAHSNEPIRFFEKSTGCNGFMSEAKLVRWQGHDFWLFGRPHALYTLHIEDAAVCGAKLAKHLTGQGRRAHD